jgi:hypothetical protein
LFISRRGQNDWVEKYEWQNIRYKVDQATKEIEEEVLGTFVHYLSSWLGPLRYIKVKVWLFDKAAIDVSQVLCQDKHMLPCRVYDH